MSPSAARCSVCRFFLWALLLLLAVWAGHFIPHSALAPFFDLDRTDLTYFIGALSFLSAVLPVWLLLCPLGFLILLLLLFFLLGKRKKCPRCKSMNSQGAKTCRCT